MNEGLLSEIATKTDSDALAPLDQKFVTFDKLAEHYNVFVGRLQEQIATIGGGGIGDLVADPSPQLGGDLDLNSKDITGTGDINITGSLTATSIAGTVTGVTQAAGDNSTKLATTAYANDAATTAAAGVGSGLVFAIALG